MYATILLHVRKNINVLRIVRETDADVTGRAAGRVQIRVNLSEKDFWEKEWQHERDYTTFPFRKVVERYLPKKPLTYFEVGCAPGTIMAFFSKVYGYHVSGIDYCDPTVTKQYLQELDVAFEMTHGDFTAYHSDRTYDVVASWGFVEHFHNFEEIIKKHKELVRPGGYLIIELPSLKYANYWIYRLFNPELLKIHNLRAMSLKALRESVQEGFEIVYGDYYKTSMFQFNPENHELLKRPFVKVFFLIMHKLMRLLRIDNIPNRFFSPYIVFIARKS